MSTLGATERTATIFATRKWPLLIPSLWRYTPCPQLSQNTVFEDAQSDGGDIVLPSEVSHSEGGDIVLALRCPKSEGEKIDSPLGSPCLMGETLPQHVPPQLGCCLSDNQLATGTAGHPWCPAKEEKVLGFSPVPVVSQTCCMTMDKSQIFFRL